MQPMRLRRRQEIRHRLILAEDAGGVLRAVPGVGDDAFAPTQPAEEPLPPAVEPQLDARRDERSG